MRRPALREGASACPGPLMRYPVSRRSSPLARHVLVTGACNDARRVSAGMNQPLGRLHGSTGENVVKVTICGPYWTTLEPSVRTPAPLRGRGRRAVATRSLLATSLSTSAKVNRSRESVGQTGSGVLVQCRHLASSTHPVDNVDAPYWSGVPKLCLTRAEGIGPGGRSRPRSDRI